MRHDYKNANSYVVLGSGSLTTISFISFFHILAMRVRGNKYKFLIHVYTETITTHMAFFEKIVS